MSLRLAFTIARRELRGGLRGFRIFLLCVTLGVSAIAGVGSLSDALVDGLRRDGRKLIGGDVELRLSHQAANKAQMAHLRASGQVSLAIEMRSMALRLDGAERGLVELKGVDGAYPLFGKMVLDQGQDLDLDLSAAFRVVDGLPGAVAEAVLLQRLKLKVGDAVKVGAARYRIAAAILREPDRGADSFVLGPRLMVARDSLGATDLIREGAQVKYRYRILLPPGSDVVAWIDDLKARFPDAGWRIRDTRNGAPGLRRFIDRMRLFLTLVGLTALLVGGLGIGNAVRSFLESKTGTIATLKCLGAPARLIFQTYLLLVMVLTALGVAAGLMIGIGTPILLSGLMADLLPFQVQFNLHPLPLLLAAGYGFLTALAFAIWPLARAQGVPAGALFRDLAAPMASRPPWRYIALTAVAFAGLAGLAILTAEERRFAVWFVCGAAVAMAVFLAAGLGIVDLARKLPRPRRAVLRLALTNLYRPGAATVPVVQSFGLGLSVLVAVIGVEGNMNLQVTERLPERAPAFFFIDILPDQATKFDSLAMAVTGVEEVERVPALRGRIVKINGVDAAKVKVAPEAAWAVRGDRGLTYTGPPPPDAHIVEGAWWPPDYTGPPLVSLDVNIAKGMGIGIGDHLTVNVLGREITAEIANLRRIDWSTLGINFVIVFAPGALEGAPHTFIATAKTTPAAELPLQTAVTDTYPNITAIRIREALEAVNQILRNIGIAVRSTAAVTLAAGILVLAGAIAANHRRRVYDAVVLKVLGATRGRILATYFLEYALLGLITALLAVFVGTAAAYGVVAQIMGMPWYWLPNGAAITTLICLVVTIGAGMAGTWMALSQKPAPLLRNE
ncbi:MAG: FtsX-like permease family protein [Rhodospirillaceae bacterium]|jgi:putative ABC transport system permease protein|nr:FtsX-like permease family protein [Rhodospirillaceae bacterium]